MLIVSNMFWDGHIPIAVEPEKQKSERRRNKHVDAHSKVFIMINILFWFRVWLGLLLLKSTYFVLPTACCCRAAYAGTSSAERAASADRGPRAGFRRGRGRAPMRLPAARVRP